MTKRSLMLAGGGLKIPFQAGVLQVWLDEAGIEFDHGDGVSAACFLVAMWVPGMSGKQIAGARVLIGALVEGGSITFVKLVGKAAEVEAQREGLLQFLASLRRTP